MRHEQIHSVVSYLCHLEEVITQLGAFSEAWGDDRITPYPCPLTHGEKFHIARRELPRLRQQRDRLLRIAHDLEKYPSEF